MFSKQQSLQIKGGAIMLLLFHHLFYTASRFEPFGVTPWFLSKEKLIIIATAARVCVWIFVFASAYGIATLFERKAPEKSIGRFVFERWFSLMGGGYWLIYPLAFAILTIAGKDVFALYNNSLLCVLVDWSGWSDFFKSPTLMGGWWYMCFAQILVIIMPVCIWLCKKWNYLMIPLLLFATQYIDKSGIVSNAGGVYISYLSAVILGILCVHNSSDLEKLLSKKKIAGIIAGMLFCMLLVARYYFSLETFPYNNRYLPWFLAGFASLAFSICISRLFSGIPAMVLAFFGKYSGSMFLIHVLFIHNVPQMVYKTKTVLFSWCTLLLVSLLLSILIEKLKKGVVYIERKIIFNKEQK